MAVTYQRIIREIAAVNPAGVEAFMRNKYGTLSHLPRMKFAEAMCTAERLEREQPGYLRRVADSFGMAAEYDRWEQS